MDPRLDEAVRRARLGDPRAFRTVAEHLAPELIRFVTYLLGGDSHAAHDVAQETLVAAWDSLGQLQGASHLRGWCYRVARWKAITWLRRQRPHRRGPSLDAISGRGEVASVPPPAPHEDLDDLGGALKRALRRLPPQYAGPVHLHYVQGCSTRETAELLGLTRSTVKMRLFRAREMLRRTMVRHPPARRQSAPARPRRSSPP